MRRIGVAAVLGAALAAATLLRLPAAWESGNALNHVSGAWMALADDLAHGVLYRPLHDPALGFGGTRFFPLAFALHAALVRAGLPLLPAGLVLSLAAGALAVLAAARFLRRAGHGPLAAAALSTLVLAGFAGQHALAAVRGDLLAAALALAGLAALLPTASGGPVDESEPESELSSNTNTNTGTGTGWSTATSALLLTLALAAKPTAAAAAAAGIAWLLLRRERGRALVLAAAVAAGGAAVVLSTDLLSGGRFLAMLRDLGPGGAEPEGMVRAPVRLLELLLREDPGGLVVLAAGVAMLTVRSWSARARPAGPVALAALWLAAAGGAAAAVLATPGTGVNHLVEPEAAAGLLVAACAAGQRIRAVRAGRNAAAAVAAAGLVTSALLWWGDVHGSRLGALRAALAAGGGPAPLLSEDPLLPLLARERPYVLDAWMLRLAAARDPALAAPLVDGLRSGAFRAVVLLHDTQAPGAEEWFSQELGMAALAELRGRWRETFVAAPYHVYRYVPPCMRPSPRDLTVKSSGALVPPPTRARNESRGPSGAGSFTGPE